MYFAFGASSYRQPMTLTNPRWDAELIAKRFKTLGYHVTELLDADTWTATRSIGNYVSLIRRSNSAAIALMYFAGHGVQVEGRNYIMTVDSANIASAEDVRRYGIDVGKLMRDVQVAGAATSVLFLDACRSNPFADAPWSSGRGSPIAANEYVSGNGSGQLASDMFAPVGAAISFSTQPEETASDGPSGQNSPYATSFAETIGEIPGIKFSELFAQIERRVLAKTGGVQRPWVSSRIIRDVTLIGR